MPRGSRYGKFHGQVALFGYADQSHRHLDARHGTLHHRAALIQDGLDAHAALLQAADDLRLAAPANFLVMSESQVNGAFGLVALLHQQFHRFQQSGRLVLDIQRAAPPDKSVCDLAGERLALPLLQRGGVRRDDIQMGQKDQRGQLRLAALPGVEQAELVDRLAGQVGVHARVHLFDQAVQAVKLTRIGCLAFVHRNGLATDEVAQSFGGGLRVHLHAGGGWHGPLRAHEAQRANEHEGNQE